MRGLGRQRPGDRDPLPLTAGQRAGQRPGLPRVQADQVGELGDAGPAAVGGPAVVQPQHLVDGGLGGLPRVEAGVRVLEDDLHLAAAAAAIPGRPGRPGPVVPAGGDGAAGGPFQADDHPRDGGLARAGLPDDGERPARREDERHVVDGHEQRRTPCAGRPPQHGTRARARRGLRHRGTSWSWPRSSYARAQRDSPPSEPGQGGDRPPGRCRGRAGTGGRTRTRPAVPRRPTAGGRGWRAAGAPSGRCPGGRRPARRCRDAADRRAAAPDAADLDDLPGVHHHRAVADGGGQLQVVGDEQHGQAEVAAQVVEDRHHLGLGGDVEGGGRLVGQQQARLGQQRRRDHDPLQHPAGQLVRVLPEPLGPVLDADLGERVDRAARAPAPRAPPGWCAAPRS